MQFSEIIVIGVIWGGLMFYFLTPFKSKSLQNNKNKSVRSALFASLLSVMMHKKAILAFAMLTITLVCVWLNYSQLKWHNDNHGGGEMAFNPITKAIYYMIGITIYTGILYFLSAFKIAKARCLR